MRIWTGSTFLAVLFAALACLGLTLTAARAVAVFHEVTETGTPGYLVLSVDSETPLWAELAPGDSMRWLIEAALHDASSGSLSVELQSSGALPDASGMLTEVEACSGTFHLTEAHSACEGVLEAVLPVTRLTQVDRDGQRYELAQLDSGDPRQVLVTFTIPPDAHPQAIDGQTARIGLGVHAAGDTHSHSEPIPSAPDDLAVTGAEILPLGVLAAGLIGLGVVLASRRKRVQTEKDGQL